MVVMMATAGLLSSYPIAAQPHHHHHHHNHHQPHHHHVKHYSEQGSTLPPQHHHQQTRQSLQYHNYSHAQRGGVNGGAMPEKERLRRMSSPEMQMQPPPQRALPRGTHRSTHSSASSNSTHYSKVILNERGKQVHQQRRSNEVKYRERPASVGSHGARRTANYQRMTAQRSEGSLPYNSLDRGMIFNRDGDPATVQEQQQQYQPQQQGGEWAPHHFSPSGSRSEMR